MTENVNYLQILKEQFNALQSEHLELRRKYELECATSTNHSESLPARLLTLTSSLLDKQRFSDVIIVQKTCEIPAHKFVLAARTDFWNDMIDVTSRIELADDVDLEGFRRAMTWMYSDEIDLKIGDHELLAVCEVACRFRLNELRNLCTAQLSARLNTENCIKIYEFSEKMSLKSLSTACGLMIAGSWSKLGPAHFSNMTAPLLYRLIAGNTKHVLHSIVSIGREDVLFLFFMQNSQKIPKILDEIDENGATALEKALDVPFPDEKSGIIADQLVEKGADLDARDDRGETILMRMLKKQNLPACDFLLKNGADGRACQMPGDYNVCHVAAKLDSPKVAEWLVRNKQRLDFDKVDAEERTPLMRSVIHNNHVISEALIECGARLDVATSEGHTALSTCLLISDSPNRRISELLLKNGATVDFGIVDETPFINELITRNDVVGVEALLAAGVDVQAVDRNRRCALHVAASVGSPEILSRIVESRRGLKWERDSDDKTPLDIALESRDLKCARIIIKGGADVNSRDKTGETLLAKAILAEDDETGVFLIEHDARPKNNEQISGKSYIEAACERGLVSTVRSFISNGCKLNARCSTGHTLIHSALGHKHRQVAALLVNFGCDLESWTTFDASGNVVDENSDEWSLRQTLLHQLIDDGDQDGAVFVIEAGADVNCRKMYRNSNDDDRFTPAHMAVSWAQNEVLKALIEKRADLMETDTDGRTAAHIGVREQNVKGVEILLSADNVEFIPIRDKFGQTVLSQSMALKNHQLASMIVARQPHAAVQTNGNGENLLHQAIRQNDLESVLFLLAVAKADATRPITDGSAKTPLHLAAVAKDEMILRNLILVNDEVNAKASDGCTPLLEALKTRNDKHAAILMENGAEPNVVDEYGENAMLCAVRSGSLDCIRAVADSPKTNRYARNKVGYTSLHICALLTIDKLPKRTTSGDVIELVLGYEEGLSEKQMASLVDARDSDGNTALMVAYSQGNAGVCRALLKRRACMGQRNLGDVNVFTYETATKQLLLGLLESLDAEPRWSDGDTCDCGARFSLTSRKHHCRHCGRHVCSKCSETSMPIAKYGEEKRVRVCDVCAHVISTGTAPRR